MAAVRTWLILPGGVPMPLSADRPLTIGRSPGCEVRLTIDGVSREHCRVFWREGVFLVEDLGSRNGTRCNGQLISTPTALTPDDILTLGQAELRLVRSRSGHLTAEEIGTIDLPSPVPTAVSSDDLARAESLQRHLVGTPPTIAGLDLGAVWTGVGGISGDLYDLAELPGGRLSVVIGDVAGHGVQGALVATTALTTIRLARPRCRGPVELLAALNRELHPKLPAGRFITACAVEIDPADGTCAIALAGHHQALVVPAFPGQQIMPVGAAGAAIGLLPDLVFLAQASSITTRLGPGDSLLLFTDGVVEAASGDGTLFGLDRLCALLRGLRRPVGGQAMAAAVQAGVGAWCGSPEDDLAVVAISRSGSGRPLSPALGSVRIRAGGDPTATCTTLNEDDSHVLRRTLIDATERLPRRVVGPSALADYRPGRALGDGGTGTVIEARQGFLDRPVALKRPTETARNRVHNFLVEGLVGALLEHPHILPVYDLAIDQDGQPFLAMRLMEQQSWRESMPVLGLERNLDILLAVTDAVAHANALGILHRDIKPANVLLGEHGQIYLADWGMAASWGDPPAQLRGLLLRPRAGHAVGTPAYMPPEVAKGQATQIGPASEVYLLGGILCEILLGRPPHGGSTVVECLVEAEANQLPAFPADEPLAQVAERSLASDPQRRPADAAAFRAELVACRANRRSVLLALEAGRDLAAAVAAGDGDGFLRARLGFEQALRLWPGNAVAQRGLSEAHLRHAQSALSRGDLDHAERLLDPSDSEHTAALIAIASARERSIAEAAALGRLQAIERATVRQWHLVYDLAGQLAEDAIRRFTVHGKLVGASGRLVLSGGQLAAALLDQAVAGDLRIEAELTPLGGLVSDASVFFAARDGIDITKVLDSGYQVKIGAYSNTLNLVIRAGRRLHAERTSPLVVGRPVRLRVDRIGRTIAVFVNDHLMTTIEDPDPLSGAAHVRLGLLTYGTEMRIDRLRIHQAGAPELEDLLATAERLLISGKTAGAEDLCAELLATPLPPQRRRLTEALLRRIELAKESALRLPRYQAAAARACPGGTAAFSGSSLRVTLPGPAADLSALAGMPIDHLSIDGCGLKELGPLAGMELTGVSATDNAIDDLRPLAGLPLRFACFDQNPITDVRGLDSAQLQFLHLRGCPRLHRLQAVSGAALRQVFLDRSHGATDITSLRGQPLEILSMAGVQVEDLTPLAGTPLRHLSIDGGKLRDLSALQGMPLRQFLMSSATPCDLGQLRTLPLAIMALELPWLDRLDAIEGLPLVELFLVIPLVRDLAPLHAAELITLNIAKTAVRSIAPVVRQPLRRLVCRAGQIEDLHLLPPSCTVEEIG
ncbi:hypothetical protein LBMAG53_27770 [Planctomycetota bacterium]|nr:hypothetical protein LBMAG53_27770 [Planctomycetota bacterium]